MAKQQMSLLGQTRGSHHAWLARYQSTVLLIPSSNFILGFQASFLMRSQFREYLKSWPGLS